MKTSDLQQTHIEGIVGRVDEPEELRLCLEEKEIIGLVFQELNLIPHEEKMLTIRFKRCIFLGCKMTLALREHLASTDNHLFGHLDVPFKVFPARLYTPKTLYKGFDRNNTESYECTPDRMIYKRFEKFGKLTDDSEETLARALHDCSMRLAMKEFLSKYRPGNIIAIMGGHQLGRHTKIYREIAMLSKRLTEKGKLMVSGGGPGAMEATHLGAWFASRTDSELLKGIDILSEAPVFQDKMWLSKAFEVMERFPQTKYRSLSIPTWFYGHEPPTPFASDICKFFDNSIREEGLLAIASGGVVYAPGSAGTMQEIFQDLAQNYYKSYGESSPMIFYSSEYWSKNVPIYPFLMKLKENGIIKEYVTIEMSDDIEHTISLLENN